MSVCPLHTGVVSKQFSTSSGTDLGEIPLVQWVTPMGVPNTVRVVIFCSFQQVFLYLEYSRI